MKNAVYVYVFDTLADWEIGYIDAEIHSGRYFRKDREPLRIVTMGNSKKTVVTMGGLKIVPDIVIDAFNMNDAAALILPGGNTWTDQIHDGVLSLAGKCLDNEIVVAAVCGSTIGLARAGLLDRRYHTSNALEVLKMVCPNYTGEQYYMDTPSVTDGNLITASGVAPLEFAVNVLKKLDVFLPEVLDAWKQLYKTLEAKYFFELMRLTQ